MKQIMRALLCAGLAITALRGTPCIPCPKGPCIKELLTAIQDQLDAIQAELAAANACGNSIAITQADIGSTGTILTEPGNYCLAGDIVFSPVNPATLSPVTISGGGTSGAGLAAISNGYLQGVFVTNGGTGYTNPTTATVGGTGTGATATAILGAVTAVTLVTPGSGYTTFPGATVTFSGGGSGPNFVAATGVVVVNPQQGAGQVVEIIIINGGQGYTSAPTVVISGPTGTPAITATATASVDTTKIAAFTVTNAGNGLYQDTVQKAITIKSSGVNLAFNGYTLSQAGVNEQGNVSSSQTPFAIGVYIPDILLTGATVNNVGLESMSVTGGTINGFSMFGAYVAGHNYDIQFSDMELINCGKLASVATRPFATYKPNSANGVGAITTGAVPFSVGGLNIGETVIWGNGPIFFTSVAAAQNRVGSVILNNVQCLDNYFLGLSMANSTNVAIQGCHFNDSFCDDATLPAYGATLGYAAVSYENPSVQNLVVQNTTFNDTVMSATYSNGNAQPISYNSPAAMYIAWTESSFFQNCTFNGTTNFFADNSGHTTFGILAESVQDITFDHCTVSNISAVSIAYGIGVSDFTANSGGPKLSPRDIHFSYCTIANIQQNAQTQVPAPLLWENEVARGFYTNTGKNITFDHVAISDVIVNGPLGLTPSSGAPVGGGACGFRIGDGSSTPATEVETENIIFSNCSAQRILTYQGGFAAGFSFVATAGTADLLRAIVLEDCVAEGCWAMAPTTPYTVAPYSAVQGTAQGFRYQHENDLLAYPVSYVGCQALRNQGSATPNVISGFGNLYSAGFSTISTSTSSVVGATPAQYQSYYECTADANVYGFMLSNASGCTVRNCRSDNNVDMGGTTGEGFTDLGAGGSPVVVGPTASLFEGNHAYNNGPGSGAFSGMNGNYNVYLANGSTIPLLDTQVSAGAGSYATNPAGSPYFAGVTNISAIK